MRRATPEDIARIAAELRLAITDAEVAGYHTLTEFMSETLERFELLPEPEVPRNADGARDPGRPATEDEDPLNAIRRWVDVSDPGARGPLTGLRIAVKDNIPIAGIPMTMGSTVLDEHVPAEDSELTRRLLKAGARIVAITNMEGFAFSGGGETCAHAQVMNPFDPSRTASGSSSGSAASLWYSGIDLAWGTDTGGSCRIPASWTGTLGLKPTHGLVPFTGIPTTDWRFDHAGPIARTVEMMALGLDAVVDDELYDDAEPLRPRRIERTCYVEAVKDAGDTLEGISIGVVREGFAEEDNPEPPEGTRETMAACRRAAERFEALGARVIEVELPVLGASVDVMFAALLESVTGATYGWPSAYHWFSRSSHRFAAELAASIDRKGRDLPENFKAVLIFGKYLNARYGGAFSARAHAYVPQMRAAVDDALQGLDAIILPTTTHTAHQWKVDNFVDRSLRGWTMLANVPLFNLTGHPALSMPAATANGLPAGVMAVGRRHEDARILRLAQVYERAYGWEPTTDRWSSKSRSPDLD
jgi:amidase